jgi:serine/threonine-protein kinase
MGSVYLANDPAIDQQVAVKIIRTDMDAYTDSSAASVALDRFRQEARAVARLDHLHILPLYRYGEDETPYGPRAYMIMQYRPEGSLWDWLRRRADLAGGSISPTSAERSSGLPLNWPLGLLEATEYLQQAASALQYAHDHGIVHRDIKPANFLLRLDLHEKSVHLLLSDFGLAKVFTNNSSTNTILGTPTYMAPEQFDGAARPESDQYALAIMIYYLLAGRAPFEGDPMQLMRQHLTADMPSIATYNPTIPPSINGVLARALAKQPEQRFPSITAFAESFARAARQPISAQQISLQGSRPSYPAASLRDEASAPDRAGFMRQPPHSPAGRAAPSPLILPGVPEPSGGMYNNNAQTAYTAQQPYPTPSPLPQMGAGMYGAQAPFGNAPDRYAPPAAGPTFTPTPRPMPAYNTPSQGPRRNEPQVGRRGALGWILGAAAVVVVGGGAGIYFYTKNNSPGGQSSQVQYVLKGHSQAVTSLSWLPTGNQLASGSLDSTARLWSASDGSAVTTINTSSGLRALAWSPSGSILATGGDDHSVQLWKPDGSLIRHNALLWGAPIYAMAWRNDSKLLFLGTYGESIHALDLGNSRHYGRNSSIRVTAVAVSPDQSTLAFAAASGEVYFANLANNWAIISRIPSKYGAALSLAWSPDGSMVAVGYADKYAVIYDTAFKQASHTLKHASAVYSVAWNPGASSPTVASGAGDGSVNIWNLAASGSPTVYAGHSDAVLALAWSSTQLASASKDTTAILWRPQTS